MGAIAIIYRPLVLWMQSQIQIASFSLQRIYLWRIIPLTSHYNFLTFLECFYIILINKKHIINFTHIIRICLKILHFLTYEIYYISLKHPTGFPTSKQSRCTVLPGKGIGWNFGKPVLSSTTEKQDNLHINLQKRVNGLPFRFES